MPSSPAQTRCAASCAPPIAPDSSPEQQPFVNLVIDARPPIAITAAPESIETALDRIDRYECDASLTAAVDDSILGRLDPDAG
ncbi:hypothetical protein [Rhodococcus rhodochrous]|uniref:hypothetical protein n=1 Tax=Rhodococcus rhodochrous TaxID=1829 RepID=UPI001EE6F6E3|nr:hypothetical protein [Rhodococcus rhodochrous]